MTNAFSKGKIKTDICCTAGCMDRTFTVDMMVHCLRQGTSMEEALAERIRLLTESALRDASSDYEMQYCREYRDALARFRLCVDALPWRERQAIQETYGTGDKVAAAASRLGISRNTLGKYRKQGLERLVLLYNSDHTEPELREMGVQSLLGMESGGTNGTISAFKATINGIDGR